MITTPPTDMLVESIRKALRSEIEDIVKREGDAAALRVYDQVRAKTGEISAKILNHFSMERGGNQLVIRIDFEGLKPKPNFGPTGSDGSGVLV